MKHQAIADEMVDVCKDVIENTGDCSNMASFIDSEGEHLCAVMYRCQKDTRFLQAVSLGVLAQMLGAVEALVIADTWRADVPVGELITPPSERPDRRECLVITRIAKDRECEMLPYRREDKHIEWGKPEAIKDFDSQMWDAWAHGLTALVPEQFTLVDVMQTLGSFGDFVFIGSNMATAQRVDEASRHLHGIEAVDLSAALNEEE